VPRLERTGRRICPSLSVSNCQAQPQPHVLGLFFVSRAGSAGGSSWPRDWRVTRKNTPAICISDHAKIFSSGGWYLPRRQCTPHTSKIAAATRVGSGLQFLPWPAQSPDLNPIENLWHDVKTRLYERKKKPKNLPELERAVKAAWKSIPPERIQALVDSMPRRIQLCIAAQGAPIQY
jgi:DDE superfamily endonuclease